LPSRLQNVPINCLAIPGSHDTFSYTVKATNDIAPGVDNIVKDLAKLFGHSAKKIIYNWSVTQHLDIYEQLCHGIRYIDVRISYCAKTDSFRFVHGLYGACIDDEFDKINRFLAENPKEIILMDINHLYEMDDERHAILLTKLESLFERKMCPVINVEDITLEMMWKNGYQILLFYCDDAFSQSLTNIWSGQSIPSPYPATCNPQQLIDYLEDDYNKPRPKNVFHVTQGILTPDITEILKNLRGSLVELGRKAMDAFFPWILAKTRGCENINVVISDFISENYYVSKILHLNSK